MRIWIDTEFNGYKGELMSIGLVAEDGSEFYRVVVPIMEPIDPWVQANVLPHLEGGVCSAIEYVQQDLAAWVAGFDSVHLVADWPTDIEHFLQLLIVGPGKRLDTPPLTMEVRRDIDCSKSAVPHHALEDAKALRLAHIQIEEAVAPVGQSVLQPWVETLPLMQQTVLLTAVRGPDGLPKYGPVKYLLRWYRRCFLMSSLDHAVISDPIDGRGGSFMGPSLEGDDENDTWEDRMQVHVNGYLRDLDAIPHHFQLHLMHAVEILGYKHPDYRIKFFWLRLYVRLVHDMHLWPETVQQLDERLGDSREGWLKRADPATVT